MEPLNDGGWDMNYDVDSQEGASAPSDIRQDVEAWQNGSQKLTAEQAGYQGPEDGPFRCDNCVFLIRDGEPCEKVSDAVKNGGCCYAFKNPAGKGLPDNHPLMVRMASQRAAAESAVRSAAGGQQ